MISESEGLLVMAIKNIEPIFVIIDDFSSAPAVQSQSTYGINNYLTNQFNVNVDVCLYDYGLLDFVDNNGYANYDNGDYYNITDIEWSVGQEMDEVYGLYPTQVDDQGSAGNFYIQDGGFSLGGTAAEPIYGNIYSWAYTPSSHAYTDAEFGQDPSYWDGTYGDSFQNYSPSHGDVVFQEFIQQLDPETAEDIHIVLIDTDFGYDHDYLLNGGMESIFNSYSTFLDADPTSSETLYPIFGMTASFGGPSGPGAGADEIDFFAAQPGAVLQASANVNQGGYNWGTDPNYAYTITVGAWNESSYDGNFMGTEDYLKNEIDVYADGYAYTYGSSGFGTSYATPVVAAEAANFLFDVVSEYNFSSFDEITGYLYDAVSPGFQDPFVFADNLVDFITTDVKVHFTDGTHEIVQVLTSDLDQNGNDPISLSGYYGEANYWGKGKVVDYFERLTEDDEFLGPVGPQIDSVKMTYEWSQELGNFLVVLEITLDTEVAGTSLTAIDFVSMSEIDGMAGHSMALVDNGNAGNILTYQLLTGQDPATWDEVSFPIIPAGFFNVMDELGNQFDVYLDLSDTNLLNNAVELISLGSGSDKFYGSDEAEYIDLGGGADYIIAGGGDDIIAISGEILLTDANPFDSKSNYTIIDTGSGNDTVEISTAAAGTYQLISGGGNDIIVIEGNVGDFSTSAVGDDVVLTGNSGVSLVLKNQMKYDENDVFAFVEFVYTNEFGEEVSEIFQIDPGSEEQIEGAIVSIVGTNASDWLFIDWYNNPADLKGLDGNDFIGGGVSDDFLDGGTGDDFLFGEEGDDTLSGGLGEDFLEGNSGSDYLAGGDGDDVYKFDWTYDGWLDFAGLDHQSEEYYWQLVVGNVDTIVDSGGTDKIWITNLPASLDPADQYAENIYIDENGTLNFGYIWNQNSENAYEWVLHPDFDWMTIDPKVMLAQQFGTYAAVTNGKETEYHLVFTDNWSAEWYATEVLGMNSDMAQDFIFQGSISSSDLKKTGETDWVGNSIDTKGGAVEVWTIGGSSEWPNDYVYSSLDLLQLYNPDAVALNEIVYLHPIDQIYNTGGALSDYQDAGLYLDFDLGKVETWPGFEELSEEDQQYWKDTFDLNSIEYPEMGVNIPVIALTQDGWFQNMWYHMSDLQNAVDGGGSDEFASISNADAELAMGFKIEDFASKVYFDEQHWNWSNTIESIVWSTPEKDFTMMAGGHFANAAAGKQSVFDALANAVSKEGVLELFLSPSGVVDLGTVHEPLYNPDGSIKSYKTTTKWKGADTTQNFLLIANEDLAGSNTLGLGFGQGTGQHTDEADPLNNQHEDFYIYSEEILTSGGAHMDIITGYDGWEYDDLMFGHGGHDWLQAEGGYNTVIGGLGADKFVINNKDQYTVVIGDQAKVVGNSFESNEFFTNDPLLGEVWSHGYSTANKSHEDVVFFDFEWPFVDPATGDKMPNSYIKQMGSNHFKVHHEMPDGQIIDVELYDVEGAYFTDGQGGLEYHALTEGRPITTDEYIDKTPYKGKSLSYEKNEVKFWVEESDPDYGGATTIAVVTTAKKTVTLPDKTKFEYEEPTVHWKGLATDASEFVFSDVTVNVINISDTDLTGSPLYDPIWMGTDEIDLIIGDEYDNVIYGGAGNDIIFGGDGKDTIFGEGGDDVLIGGNMDDILYGDYEFDSDIPDLTMDEKGNIVDLAPELAEGNDVIVGGMGKDEIVTGDGNNVAVSGDLADAMLNAELDSHSTFVDMDDEDDVYWS
jgi:Ca2+-binding RTX toxin-like protein